MKIKPIQSKIVIKEEKPTGMTASGIYVVEKEQTAACKGTVLWVGQGRTNDQGDRIPGDIKPGDTVYYAKIFGIKVIMDHEEYVVVEEKDILFAVEK